MSSVKDVCHTPLQCADEHNKRTSSDQGAAIMGSVKGVCHTPLHAVGYEEGRCSVKGVCHTPLHAVGYEEGRCSVKGVCHTPLQCADFSRSSLFNCIAPLLQTTLIPLTFPALLLAFGFGVGIGLFYFGGLWWTTQQVPHRRSPALWLLGSFALRTLLAVIGFYLVMQGRPERLLVCLFGFWIARLVCVRRFGQIATPPRKSPSTALTSEPSTALDDKPLSTVPDDKSPSDGLDDKPPSNALASNPPSNANASPAISRLHKPQSPLE